MSLEDPDRALAASLRLRGEPAAPVRLSRRAIALATAATALALAGVTILALGSPRKTGPAVPAVPPAPSQAPAPAALAALPRDYTLPPGVPRLGPPMNPVLGTPAHLLEAPAAGSGQGSTDPAAAQHASELKQALASGLMVSRTAQASPPLPLTRTADDAMDSQGGPTVTAPPAAPTFRVAAGATLRAALVTELRSGGVGTIVAQTTDNLYGGPDGRSLLIPQGSRLLGEARGGAQQGGGLTVAWARLVLPDGRAVALPKGTSSDVTPPRGLWAAIQGRWSRLAAASLASLGLAAGAQLGRAGNEAALLQALRDGGADTASQAGAQFVRHALETPDTVAAPAGALVQVILGGDLELPASPGS